jgi:cytochrome P450
VGPNTLSFDSNCALQPIYGSKANCWKGRFYTAFSSKKGVYNTQTSINREEHAKKRRVLSHAFSDRALKSMEEQILVHVRDFCSRLGAAIVPQNAALWCDSLMFDVMGDLCFGKSFGMLEKPENRFASELICKAAKRHVTVGVSLLNAA